MFGQKNTNAMRYAIYRTHLAEKHTNSLYAYLVEKFPEDSDFLEGRLHDWKNEVGELHDAFLRGDTKYMDEYERRFS
jgi:hypothetical protein